MSGRDTDRRHVAIASGAGAGAGYGGYLASGNAIARTNNQRTREQYQLNRKANDRKVKRVKHVMGLPTGKPVAEYTTEEKNAFFRNYPASVPGGKTKRVQARVWGAQKYGKLRPALAAAGAGTVLGARGMTSHQNGHGVNVNKSLYARDRKVSATHLAETGAGVVLGAWGLGRSGMLGRALSRGVKAAATRKNPYALEALQQAQAAQGVLARATAIGERHLRQIRAVDQAVNRVPAAIRPEVAAAAGMLLVAQGHPVRRNSYTPVNIRIRGGY